jgi:hypothetical protein
MKKMLILFIMSLLSVLLSAQNYPKIDIDSTGQKVVIFTIEQARQIDTKLEILELLEQSQAIGSDMDSLCFIIIDEKNNIIYRQETHIKLLDDLIAVKDKKIENLTHQISDYMEKEKTYKKELDNKDEEIGLHKNKIKDLQKRLIIGGGTAGIVIAGLVLLLIL